MKLSKIQKKVATLTVAAGIGIVTCGTGAFAGVTRGPFQFKVAVGKKDTSNDVQKTTETNDPAAVTVSTYKNTTGKSLRLRILRSSTAVTGYHNISSKGSYTMRYTKTAFAGQSFKLRGYVASNASKGTGTMEGIFQP